MAKNMFNLFRRPEKKPFEFPKSPCYAAVVEKFLTVELAVYFSGANDAKLAIVRLFDSIEDALQYLKDTPSAKGGYILCLDQERADIEQAIQNKQGFGSHIVTAVSYNDYVQTTWEHNTLAADNVRVIANPHYITPIVAGSNTAKPSLTGNGNS